MSDVHQARGARVLAVLLIIGGLLGVGIACWMGYQFIQIHWVYIVLVALFLAVFIWSAIAGVRLWRGEAQGWKWATILFAMQIPVLTVPGFSYEFYTGLALRLVGGDVQNVFSFSLGANANIYLGTSITGLVYGINVLAVAALMYLILRRRSLQAAVDAYE